MNAAQLKKILILVTILAVPGFLYYLLQEKGENRYKKLPVFGPKTVASTFHSVRGKKIPDTIYHVIPDFDLINQYQATVRLKHLRDKIVLYGLFNPDTTGNRADHVSRVMQKYAGMYAKNNLLHFVSITAQPVKEQPVVPGAYAKQLTTPEGKWDLLTGDSTAVYPLIREGLFLDMHSNLIVLTDSQHRIRGYYDVTNNEALSKLDDEIKVLIVEELRNIKDGR